LSQLPVQERQESARVVVEALVLRGAPVLNGEQAPVGCAPYKPSVE
jgi:hypothetical protein